MNLKTHEYTPDDVECGYCTEFSKKTGCKAGSCKYLAERIQAGVLTYQDAVMSMHPQKDGVSQRLQEVAANPSGFWMDEAHHRRMRDVDATMGFIRKRNTPRYYAIMYLLTAREDLYRRTANCFFPHGIDLRFVVYPGLLINAMPLLVAAHMIRDKEDAELLVNTCQVDDLPREDFVRIVNALLIARYGTVVFHLEGGGGW